MCGVENFILFIENLTELKFLEVSNCSLKITHLNKIIDSLKNSVIDTILFCDNLEPFEALEY